MTELKPIKKEDLDTIRKWRNSRDISKYMYTDIMLSKEDQEEWYEKIKKDETKKYWVIYFDSKKIGVLNLYGIDLINEKCGWAYYIGDISFQGRGIARHLECGIYDYVFDIMKINKLYCEVFTFNKKVIEIHEKFGSVMEGTFREYIKKDNEYLDVVYMSILKSKWQRIRNNFSYQILIN